MSKKANIISAVVVVAAFVAGGAFIYSGYKMTSDNNFSVSDSSSAIVAESINSEISQPDNDSQSSQPDENSDDTEMYDYSAVVNAYKNGNTDSLNDLDKLIYQLAKEALDSLIESDMTDVQKELVIHDYLMNITAYDDAALDIFGEHTENSDNPYGTLFIHKSICKGYATTFAMLCNMVDIECKIIHGTNMAGEEHAWNVVKLDDEWYQVDATWDDSDSDDGVNSYDFFNADDTYMALTHVWDKTLSPECTSTKYFAAEIFCNTVNSIDDFKQALNTAINQGTHSRIYIAFDKSSPLKLDNDTGADIYSPYYVYNPQQEYPEIDEITTDCMNEAGKDSWSYSVCQLNGRAILIIDLY